MSAYSIATRGLAGRKVPQGVLTPMGELLFSASEPGAWYDPSDMSTLFQDSAGTTPVTAVEQPVGRMLDKSGRGNHATQATTTKRPVLSRRVNLLLTTETLAAWALTGIGGASLPVITPGQADHVGGNTGVRVVLSLNGATATSAHSRASFQFPVTSGTAYTIRFWIKSNTGSNSTLRFRDDLSQIANGYVTATPDWQFVTHTGTATGGVGSSTTSPLWLRGGDGTSDFADVTIAHMSTTLATDAHLPYQRVNTATDYDADPAKFPAYLRFDGVDDALQTGSIDFTGTDKMTVWAGVTKLSDAAGGTVLELSANSFANNGTIGMFTPSAAAGNNIFQRSRGTAQSTVFAAAIAPTSFIWTAASSINPPSNAARLAGVQVAANTVSQGTGNFGNYPLYIGASAGTAYYFNGRLYSLIVRGAQSNLSQIEAAERYIKQKMRLP